MSVKVQHEIFSNKSQLEWCEWSSGKMAPRGTIWRRMNHDNHRFYFSRIDGEIAIGCGITTAIDKSHGESIYIRKWKDNTPNWQQELKIRADYGTLCHTGLAELAKNGKLPKYLSEIADEVFNKKKQFLKDMTCIKKFILDYKVEFHFIEGILGKEYIMPNGTKCYICSAIDVFCSMFIPVKKKVPVQVGVYSKGKNKGQPKYENQLIETVEETLAILDLKSNYTEEETKTFYSSHKQQLIFGRELICSTFGIDEETEVRMFNLSTAGWRTEPKYILKEHLNEENEWGYTDKQLLNNRLNTAIMEGNVQPKGEIFVINEEISLDSENDYKSMSYIELAEQTLIEIEQQKARLQVDTNKVKERKPKSIKVIESESKVYLKKSDFCRKYNISIKSFNKTMIESGLFSSKTQPNEVAKKYIIKVSGTWEKGAFAYEEEYIYNLILNRQNEGRN
jgi:hypothetical protein